MPTVRAEWSYIFAVAFFLGHPSSSLILEKNSLFSSLSTPRTTHLSLTRSLFRESILLLFKHLEERVSVYGTMAANTKYQAAPQRDSFEGDSSFTQPPPSYQATEDLNAPRAEDDNLPDDFKV